MGPLVELWARTKVAVHTAQDRVRDTKSEPQSHAAIFICCITFYSYIETALRYSGGVDDFISSSHDGMIVSAVPSMREFTTSGDGTGAVRGG